jgi:hypothetical protein
MPRGVKRAHDAGAFALSCEMCVCFLCGCAGAASADHGGVRVRQMVARTLQVPLL